MNTEKTLEIILETGKVTTLVSLCNFLKDKWVYFYVINDGSFINGAGIEEIVNISKERPINIPTVLENDLHNAVIYINKSTAINSLKPEYRLGQMKGEKAFSMFSEIETITGIILQGQKVWTSFPITYLPKPSAPEA